MGGHCHIWMQVYGAMAGMTKGHGHSMATAVPTAPRQSLRKHAVPKPVGSLWASLPIEPSLAHYHVHPHGYCTLRFLLAVATSQAHTGLGAASRAHVSIPADHAS